MKTLSIDSTVKELQGRRDEIALEYAELQAEHRRLGALINAKQMDVGAMKAEHERLGSIIAVTDMAMEADNG